MVDCLLSAAGGFRRKREKESAVLLAEGLVQHWRRTGASSVPSLQGFGSTKVSPPSSFKLAHLEPLSTNTSN